MSQGELFKNNKRKRPSDPIPERYHWEMYRICLGVKHRVQIGFIPKSLASRIAGILGQLRDMGANLDDLQWFGDWWETKQAKKPSPEQVKYWWYDFHKDLEESRQAVDGVSIDRQMREHARRRNDGA